MYDHRKIWPITILARVLQVGTSGYYGWIHKPNSPRHDRDAQLQIVIRNLFENSRGVYGSPRIHEDLIALGYRVGRKRIERLMKEMGISPRRPPAPFIRTTDSNHDNPIALNLLKQNFHTDTPNKVWVGDITYIYTDEGWLFLATTIDLFSRKLVGWAFAETMETDLIARALDMAIDNREQESDLIFHSDRGSQYTSAAFQTQLKDNHIQSSMSAKGCCYDNAVAESFFHTLKVECVYRTTYATRAEAQASIFDYIATFYNTQRRHSTIDYCSPNEFERNYHAVA